MPADDQAVGVVRAGGVISRVGVPQYDDAPVGLPSLFGRNITLTGGPAPARAYIETLLPDVLSGQVDPGKVFDSEVPLTDVADGYRAMHERTALKVLAKP
jgi:threonine dehydrogenase-like Zn-dependent dehydrogenase